MSEELELNVDPIENINGLITLAVAGDAGATGLAALITLESEQEYEVFLSDVVSFSEDQVVFTLEGAEVNVPMEDVKSIIISNLNAGEEVDV